MLEYATVPTKRQSLIPFPRVGKRGNQAYDASFHRRILRSNWPKRDDFKRRLTRRSSWGKSSKSFDRRILRSTPAYGEGFKRRITRSWDEATPSPEISVRKRQSLIPFPRTGKRSVSTESSNNNRELDQVYIYDSSDDDPEIQPEVEPEPEPEPKENEEDIDIMINSDDFDSEFEDSLDDDSLGSERDNPPSVHSKIA